MEEIIEGTDHYIQEKREQCSGCEFYDEEEPCTAPSKFYNLCVVNKKIWIKKEPKREETKGRYVDKDDVL